MNRQLILTLIVAVYAKAQTPYPPSGWRPQGQPFTLPSRQVRPEYGVPDSSVQIPSTQYLPNLEPAGDFARNNVAFNGARPNYEAPNNNQQRPNTQYSSNFEPGNSFASAPNSGFPSQFTPTSPVARERPFNNNNQNMRGNLQLEQQSNNRFQNVAQAENFGRQFLPNSRKPNDAFPQQRNFKQGPPRNNKEADSDEDEAEEFAENREFSNQTEDFDDVNATTPPREYGAAVSTTKRPVKVSRKKAQRTTPRPATTTEAIDENESDQPNIAVSTALASSGQYYVLQPDGRLQRVVYMTAPSAEGDTNAYTANLMYENIEPIKGPIFSYNDSPLLRLNK